MRIYGLEEITFTSQRIHWEEDVGGCFSCKFQHMISAILIDAQKLDTKLPYSTQAGGCDY